MRLATLFVDVVFLLVNMNRRATATNSLIGTGSDAILETEPEPEYSFIQGRKYWYYTDDTCASIESPDH